MVEMLAPVEHMNGWDKRNAVEVNLKDGDALSANRILSSVQDQKLFMDLLASKATDDSSLRHLQVINGTDGHPSTIKTDDLVITRDGDGMTAHGVGMKSKALEAFNKGLNAVEGIGTSIKEAWNNSELGQDLKNAGTEKSVRNQAINRDIDRAEGNTPAPKAKDI